MTTVDRASPCDDHRGRAAARPSGARFNKTVQSVTYDPAIDGGGDGPRTVHTADGAPTTHARHPVDAASVTRHRHRSEIPLDGLDSFVEPRSTLAGTAYEPTEEPTTSAQLAVAGFLAVETGMTEGRPCFVANNGRPGFGVDEYRARAPGAAAGIKPVRPAARRDRARFTAGAGLDSRRPDRGRAEQGDLARRTDPSGCEPSRHFHHTDLTRRYSCPLSGRFLA